MGLRRRLQNGAQRSDGSQTALRQVCGQGIKTVLVEPGEGGIHLALHTMDVEEMAKPAAQQYQRAQKEIDEQYHHRH